MANVTINGKPVGPQPSDQVISRSAILILSGALIGTTITQGPLTGVSFCGFCAGIAGMISFFALDVLSHHRRNRAFRKTLAAVETTLSTRVRRHVTSQSITAPKRVSPLSAHETSYLPVTSARR